MFTCDRCEKESKVVFNWRYHLDATGWNYSEHLCENCYFSILGADPTDIPINDIPELPKLSGIYNS